MKHGTPFWKKKSNSPEVLSSSELERLSERERLAYWAAFSVHQADRSRRYAISGALLFGAAVLLLTVALSVLVVVSR